MSSLIFYTDPSQALVATDTLAVRPDGTPLMYGSKALYLPHLKTIVAGTGLGMFSGRWANYVNDHLIVRGLRNLDFHTPDGLRDLWVRMRTEQEVPDVITTTVYQIGVSEDDGEIRSFAYRSVNEFVSEPLAHGTRAKPDCSFPNEGHIIEHLKPMMLEQRSIQALKPAGERLYIGGECVVMHLTKQSCTTATLFRFDDYEAQLDEIFERFQRAEG
jgi:hypothetical protein